MSLTRRRRLARAAAVPLAPAAGGAQTEIQFWHAMGRALGEKTKELAAGFNRSQSEYWVNASGRCRTGRTSPGRRRTLSSARPASG